MTAGRQTWWGSIVEAKTNIVIGFCINYAANIVVLPLLWNPVKPLASAFYIGIVFTVISVARQLFIRRYFNGIKFGNTQAPEPVNSAYWEGYWQGVERAKAGEAH